MLDARPKAFEATVIRATMGHWGPLLLTLPVLLVWAVSRAVAFGDAGILWFGWSGLLALFAPILAMVWPGRRPTKLHVTPDTMTVARATIRRADVASGFVQGDVVVLLDAKGRTIETFTLPGRGDELLAFWQIDAKVAALEVALPSPYKDSSLLACGFLVAAALSAVVGWVSFTQTAVVSATYLLFWGALSSAPMRVRVGRDGLTMRFLGGTRYIPFRNIVAAALLPDGLLIELARGKPIRLRGSAEDPSIRAIHERIQVARNGDATVEPIAALDRVLHGGDEAWLAHVRALAQTTSYRHQTFDCERLWAVCEDGHQPEAARAAAAYVLRLRLPEPQTAQRLRVSADTAANPQLRVSMSEIAEADPTALDGALLRVLEPRAQ